MFEVHTGLRKRPVIVLIYGLPGVGKTELASQFGSPLFLDVEKGTDFLDVSSIQPKTFEQVREALVWAAKQPQFDTVVLDSWSACEKMALSHTLESHGIKSLGQLDHGKGYGINRDYIRRLIAGLEYVRDSGKNVVLLAHTKIKKVEDPTMPTYDRIEFDCDKEMLTPITSICDGCFYFRPMIRTMENKDKETKVVSNGSKELLLADKGGAIGKSRFNHMPPTYEFPFEQDGEKRTKAYQEFWLKLQSKIPQN